MDEVVLRRVVGVVTLAIAAFLLSWLLPRPGLDRLRGEGERVVTVDLTRPDSRPQEVPPPSEGSDPAEAPSPPVAEAAPAPPEPPSEPAPAAAEPFVAAPSKPVPAEPKPAEPKPAESKPVESKPPESKPAPSPPKVAEALKPAKPAAAPGAGQVMVQAGAYSFLDKAEAVRTRAGAQGQHCVISPAETPKGTLYRLRCGPYPDRDKAQAAVKALTASGIAAQVIGGGR